jgi:hypothetical protein
LDGIPLSSACGLAAGRCNTISRSMNASAKDGEYGVESTVVDTVYLAKLLFGADALLGRGTRVFEARKLDDEGNPVGDTVATKDVWGDDDREREGTVREKSHQGARGEDKVLIEKYFLTVLDHGDVVINGQVDHIRDLIMRHRDVPVDRRFLLPLETRHGLGIPQS